MVYTPSLMDIPEYPENVIPNSYYATQEVTGTFKINHIKI